MSLFSKDEVASDEAEIEVSADEGTTAAPTGEVEVTADGEPKESYQARLRKRQIAAATLIKGVIAKNNITLTAEEQAAMDLLAHASQRTGNFGTPVINKIFGDTLAVGAKVTAMDVFQKTGKGYAEIRQLIKKWAEKGITVVYETTTSYTITQLA